MFHKKKGFLKILLLSFGVLFANIIQATLFQKSFLTKWNALFSFACLKSILNVHLREVGRYLNLNSKSYEWCNITPNLDMLSIRTRWWNYFLVKPRKKILPKFRATFGFMKMCCCKNSFSKCHASVKKKKNFLLHYTEKNF